MDWNDVASEIGISPESLRAIRKGRNGPKEITARAIDDWLGWEPGGTEALFDGGEPSPRQSEASASPMGIAFGTGPVELKVLVNPDDPEPEFPPGGVRDQIERFIWAIDEPWHIRWAQIQTRRELLASVTRPEDERRHAERGR